MTDFTDMEYKLTKFIIDNTTVRNAAILWSCTSKTIINRMKRFEK